MPSGPKNANSMPMRRLVEGTAPRAASPKPWPPGKPPGGELPHIAKPENENKEETF